MGAVGGGGGGGQDGQGWKIFFLAWRKTDGVCREGGSREKGSAGTKRLLMEWTMISSATLADEDGKSGACGLHRKCDMM